MDYPCRYRETGIPEAYELLGAGPWIHMTK